MMMYFMLVEKRVTKNESIVYATQDRADCSHQHIVNTHKAELTVHTKTL